MTTKSSRTLDRQEVNEIGLKSPSSIGDCISGMGIILDSLKITGTIPDRSDVLKIVVIGSASSYANSLTIRHGTLSGPGGGTPYYGLYGEAPPERGTLFRLQVYERVRISQVEVYKRVGKSVI